MIYSSYLAKIFPKSSVAFASELESAANFKRICSENCVPGLFADN
jgi:hypothetical protein